MTIFRQLNRILWTCSRQESVKVNRGGSIFSKRQGQIKAGIQVDGGKIHMGKRMGARGDKEGQSGRTRLLVSIL